MHWPVHYWECCDMVAGKHHDISGDHDERGNPPAKKTRENDTPRPRDPSSSSSSSGHAGSRRDYPPSSSSPSSYAGSRRDYPSSSSSSSSSSNAGSRRDYPSSSSSSNEGWKGKEKEKATERDYDEENERDYDEEKKDAWWKTGTVVSTIENFSGNPEFDATYPEIQEVKRAAAEHREPDRARVSRRRRMHGRTLVALRAPTEEELAIVTAIGRPVAEVGAGSGYWARCLYNRGCDIAAYDRFPAEKGYYPVVRKKTVDAAKDNANRVLLIVWPSYKLADALRAYDRFGGDCVVYAGEMPGLSTITEEDHAVLTRELGFVCSYELRTRKRMHLGIVGDTTFDQLAVYTKGVVSERTRRLLEASVGPSGRSHDLVQQMKDLRRTMVKTLWTNDPAFNAPGIPPPSASSDPFVPADHPDMPSFSLSKRVWKANQQIYRPVGHASTAPVSGVLLRDGTMRLTYVDAAARPVHHSAPV
jgi:hypothetical protein